jgi:ketosteroid isomerase-like protein
MKTIAISFVLLAGAIFYARSQVSSESTTTARDSNPSNADEVAILRIAEAWKAHYNAGDAAKVAGLYAENGYYVSAHILAHGRAAIQGYWERGIAASGHIDSFKPVEVRFSGDMGYCLGKYQATNAGITVDGRVVIVLRKIEGRWYIAVHETVVRDQPE